jgi:hypothetical protein
MEKIIALYEKKKDSFAFDQEARTRVDDVTLPKFRTD